MREELGSRGAVWHDPEKHPCPDEINEPDNQEDELPGLDMRAVSVAQSVTEERADHGCGSVEGEEDAHSKRLLGTGVEHGDNVHDGGRDGGFEHAKEEAENEHASVVPRCDVAAQQDRPRKDHSASVLRDRQALNEVVGWECPEEVSEIEDGSDP